MAAQADVYNDKTEEYVYKLPSLEAELEQVEASWLASATSILRQITPSLISIFLCATLVVVRPVAELSGTAQYAFLVLVAYTLFFHVGGHTLGQHIQNTVIGVLGACIGLGWSALAVELGCIANRQAGKDDSVGGRAAPAIFLAAIAFMGADLKSRLPRVTSGALVAIFVCIWSLASSVRISEISAGPFLGLLYAILFPAGISLLVNILVLRKTAHKQLTDGIDTALDISAKLLLASLHLFQAEQHQVRSLHSKVSDLRKGLTSNVVGLPSVYEEATYEITFSTKPVTSYEPAVQLAKHLHMVLCSRTGLIASGEELMTRQSHLPPRLRGLVDALGVSMLRALALVRRDIQPDATARNVRSILNKEKNQPSSTRLAKDIQVATVALRQATGNALHSSISASPGGESVDKSTWIFRQDTYRDAFFVTSLLELSDDILRCMLTVADQPITASQGAKRRVWLPSVNWRRFFTGRRVDIQGRQGIDGQLDQFADDDERASTREALSDLGRRPSRSPSMQLQRPRHRKRHRIFKVSYYAALATRLIENIYAVWDSPYVKARRVALHKRIHAVRNSQHLKHGAKCAVGVSLLTLPGHLPADSAGYRWFESIRGPWIAISFLYAFQTTTALTYRVAFFRTLGTLLGSLYALACQRIAKENAYGLVAFMIPAALLTDYWIICAPRFANLGTVAQLTLPSILFVPYLRLDFPSVVGLAFERAYDIEIGIVAALIISVAIWPYHANVQIVITSAKATDKLIRLYLSMSKMNMQRRQRRDQMALMQFEQLEDNIRVSLTRSNELCNLLHLEISLLPKPITAYRAMLAGLSRILHLFSGIRLIRQHIPRQLTVLDVLHQRTELVSSILIVLHAISHSLHTSSAVPQFLPHPRANLEALSDAIEEHVKDMYRCSLAANQAEDASRPSSSKSGQAANLHRLGKVDCIDFDFIYASAECEAISEAIQAIEDLLDICKALYGTADFIQASESGLESSVSASGYSTPRPRTGRTS